MVSLREYQRKRGQEKAAEHAQIPLRGAAQDARACPIAHLNVAPEILLPTLLYSTFADFGEERRPSPLYSRRGFLVADTSSPRFAW